jgi:hypothetical protein
MRMIMARSYQTTRSGLSRQVRKRSSYIDLCFTVVKREAEAA